LQVGRRSAIIGAAMRMVRDLQFAIRTLGRSPGFTGLVVLALALGIGAGSAIFSVVHAVVLRPLDYPEPERLVRITSELRGFGATDTGVAPAELIDYQARTDLFTGVAGVMPLNANVTGSGAAERVEMMLVSQTYFDVLGVRPALGRTFTAEDDTPGVANVAVVSDGFWRRRLNADPQAIGRSVVIDDDPILVVGVMPAGFHHPGRTLQGEVDVWSPTGFRAPSSIPPSRSRRRLDSCLARLQRGVTVDHASARLAQYGVEVRGRFPDDYPARDGWAPRVNTLQDSVVGGVATPMFVLLCGVGLLFLVACVNVAHLVLARMWGRRQEVAIRRALGASGGRLLSQFASEGAVLAFAGGTFGALVGSWGLRGLTALAPARVPRIENVTLDFTAVVVAALVSLVLTVLLAFSPILQVRGEIAAPLKDGGRSSGGGSGRARGILVGVEVALATVLLVAAGLLIRTVVGLLNVPVGFDTEHLLTARLALPRPNDPSRAAYLDPARRGAFYRESLRRVQALPGVDRAAMASQIPLGGFNPPLFVEIESRAAESVRPVVHDFEVSDSYFATLGIAILKGRPFADSDRAGSEPVAIVSETAGRMFWRGENPIGAHVRLASDGPWMTIVGVAGDVLNRRLSESPQPILYRPLEQASDLGMALLVRTRGDAPGLGRSIAGAIAAVDPGVPVYSERTMRELIDAAVAQRHFLMRLLTVFGALATALALLGIYGVMAYSVSQRTREIGIRLAIGARPSDVSGMVMRRGMLLTGAGVAGGLALGAVLTRWVQSQLFGVQPSDPLTIASVILLMATVAAVAVYAPARRAARVDPVVVLRSQ
jgi:putative ABC transport system permease protein